MLSLAKGPIMGGIKYARTLVPMPQVQKWDVEAIRAINVTPWAFHEAPIPEVIRVDRPNGVEQSSRVPKTRRAYIRQKDLDQFGCTKNCPKCQSIIAYGHSQQSFTPHSSECMACIMSDWAKSEQCQLKLQRVQTRTDQHLANQLQRNVEAAAASQGGMFNAQQQQQHSPFEFVHS